MKKIIIIIVLMILLSGCNSKQGKDEIMLEQGNVTFNTGISQYKPWENIEEIGESCIVPNDVISNHEVALAVASAIFEGLHNGNEPVLVPVSVFYDTEDQVFAVSFYDKNFIGNYDYDGVSGFCIVLRQSDGKVLVMFSEE